MAIVINNLKINLDQDIETLKKMAAKELKVSVSDIESIKILRESVDARRCDIKLVYRVLLTLKCNEQKALKKSRSKNASIHSEKKRIIEYGSEELKGRIVIAGAGPAGLFCAYTLAKHGYNPLIIERGEKVDDRKRSIDNFWNTGDLNENSNVQFGEGGAGTFSDGKLTTRIKDVRVQEILDIFVKNGAPDEISYSHKPHIGTDLLIDVIKNMREEIINMGAEFMFSTKLTDIELVKDSLSDVETVKSIRLEDVSGTELEHSSDCSSDNSSHRSSNSSTGYRLEKTVDTENLVLAIGHSARDTYSMIFDKGIEMSQKPFAIGVRVEHPQDMIDSNQYGECKDHPKLKASEYKLTNRTSSGRSCYSFCMCPGGTVVASSSEPGMLVVNGMSEHARDKANANSAIVVSVNEDDFGSDHPLAGMEFQRKYEKMAFELAGCDYKAPVQLLSDFKENRASEKIGIIQPSHTRGYVFKDLNKCLPDYVSEAIKESMDAFDRKISGFAHPDTVLTGIETRTSAPLRIQRDESFQSNIKGLYPCGEGAGYAGGIVSAAVDGMKIAEEIMKKYKKPNA